MGNLLPDEIIEAILLRLPAVSLIRFKSVHKSWYRLIKSPKFVSKHLFLSINLINDPNSSSTTILLKRLVDNDSGIKENILSLITYYLNTNTNTDVLDIELPPCYKDSKRLEICGQSHGIVCLTDLYKHIYLCNPATREFRRLPPSILLLTEPPLEPDGYMSRPKGVGFGYDPNSNDFKVVRIIVFVEGPAFYHPSRVELYDLSKDQWREIKIPVVDGLIFWAPSFQMYYNGIYYWWAIHNNRGIIISFDMNEEVLRHVPVPASVQDFYVGTYRTLGVWNGFIVLFHYLAYGNEKEFHIWVMDKEADGISVSWFKLLTIGPLFGIEKPLLFVNSYQLLMEAKDGQVVSFNLYTKEFKNLPVKGYPAKFQGFVFPMSLLSVKGGMRVDFGIA